MLPFDKELEVVEESRRENVGGLLVDSPFPVDLSNQSVDQSAVATGWHIVAPDLSVDTSTANGRLMANLLMTLGQWESDMVSERTRDALAAKKAAGVHVGRPASVPENVVKQIKRWSARGWDVNKIARTLNERDIPTAGGGVQWWPATIRRVLDRTRQRAPRRKSVN